MKVILNSYGDIAVVKEMVVGYEVSKAVNSMGFGHESAVLEVRLINNLRIVFEVAGTDEELEPRVKRFRELLEEADRG